MAIPLIRRVAQVHRVALLTAFCAAIPLFSHSRAIANEDPPKMQQPESNGVLEEKLITNLKSVFDTSAYQPRWNSQHWNYLDGWLLVTSEIAMGIAFALAAMMALYCLAKRKKVSHSFLWWFTFAFLLICAICGGLEAIIFWWPAYRLTALVRLAGALIAIGVLLLLIPVLSKLLKLRSATELEQEIAQRRRTELELRKVHSELEGVIELRTAQLAAKNEEMEHFLNAVTHDLKSPVSTCMGLAGLLRDDIKSQRYEELTDTVNRMDRSIARMRRLIENLLHLSRIGRVPLNIVDVDPLPLVQAVVEDLELRIRAARVTVVLKDPLPMCRADMVWLTEIFENLVNNAIKYGSDNPNPVITIGSRTTAGECQYFVRDNGRGIDPAYHAKILQPFQRLRTDKDGSGIGLTIVQRIVKMHGGRIWIESLPGEGACFWFALPKAATASPETASLEKGFQATSITDRM